MPSWGDAAAHSEIDLVLRLGHVTVQEMALLVLWIIILGEKQRSDRYQVSLRSRRRMDERSRTGLFQRVGRSVYYTQFESMEIVF